MAIAVAQADQIEVYISDAECICLKQKDEVEGNDAVIWFDAKNAEKIIEVIRFYKKAILESREA